MFYLWRRMDEEDRGRVWRLYGWFSGLMMCGSCVGALAWAAEMNSLVNLFKGYDSSSQVEQSSLLALSSSWHSAFQVTHAIEFLCLSAAKLTVLDRMSVFAAPQGTRLQTRWAAAGRIVMAVVVLGNAVGLAANVASAVHYQRAAEAASTATAHYAANNTNDGDNFRLLEREEKKIGGSILSAQRFLEVIVLLLIIIAFALVGVLSARRVSSRLLAVDAASSAAATGRALRLQILGTTAFIFVAFLIRSVLSFMLAVAFGLRDNQKTCPGSEKFDYCASCYNLYTHMSGWLVYSPQFEATVVLISSPATLLVALWGMTPKSTLQLMHRLSRQ
jgi:hypothetical protein